MTNETGVLSIEGAKITFKNFAGKESDFNKEGDRNFSLVIDDLDMVDKLREDGWNVKCYRSKKHPDAEPMYYIPVSVSYKFDRYAPNIWVINPTTMTKTRVTKDTVSMLDYIEYDNIDVTVRPRIWDDKGVTRVKAFLKTLYITKVPDEYEDKYAGYSDSDPAASESPKEDDVPWA